MSNFGLFLTIKQV